jgi:hypothetical protein
VYTLYRPTRPFRITGTSPLHQGLKVSLFVLSSICTVCYESMTVQATPIRERFHAVKHDSDTVSTASTRSKDHLFFLCAGICVDAADRTRPNEGLSVNAVLRGVMPRSSFLEIPLGNPSQMLSYP